MVSMAGSQIINEPGAITWGEMRAWMDVTGHHLNRFEYNSIIAMDAIWINATISGTGQKRTGQDIGEYCQGKKLVECKRYYGEALAQVCSTCPS